MYDLNKASFKPVQVDFHILVKLMETSACLANMVSSNKKYIWIVVNCRNNGNNGPFSKEDFWEAFLAYICSESEGNRREKGV